MAKEALTHIKRTQLPWRLDDGLTECGIDAATHLSESRDESLARLKQMGDQRFAILTCMTCMQQANVRYRRESVGIEDGAVDVLGRECQRVAWRNADGKKRLADELEAITALIERHRDEFDAYLESKAGTLSLDDARQERAVRKRYAK